MPKINCNFLTDISRFPKNAPKYPPIKTTTTNGRIISKLIFLFIEIATKLLNEFKTINALDVAAVVFVSPQPKNNIIGLKNIPPPIPINPETVPSTKPINAER